jgi:T-complex protein 1 subunit eta
MEPPAVKLIIKMIINTVFKHHPVVILAAEFLKAAKPFVEEGVSPQLVIKAFNNASQEAIKKLRELAIRVTGANENREMLIRCAATTLSSKLVQLH